MLYFTLWRIFCLEVVSKWLEFLKFKAVDQDIIKVYNYFFNIEILNSHKSGSDKICSKQFFGAHHLAQNV